MSTESQIENPKEFVEKAIDADKLVVFSKTYWPYASKAKKLLTTIGAVFKVYELNSLGEPRNGTLLCLGLFQYTQTSNFPTFRSQAPSNNFSRQSVVNYLFLRFF